MPRNYAPTAVPSLQEIEPIAVFPLQGREPTPIPPQTMSEDYHAVNTTIFTTTLHSGEVYKFVLGPCTTDGGYLVDITPLEASTNGAHIEQQILPEFDGEMWVDVLSLLLPEQASPLLIQVELASTVGWPIAFQQILTYNPGDWTGFIIQESKAQAGYVIEINPLSAGEFGDRVEKALVQPEFTADAWWDVLRIQIPVEQAAMEAQVVIYQTPSNLPVAAEYELVAEPGVWHGLGVGLSKQGGAYVVEMTPTTWDNPSWLYRYTIQPEFDGENWNDVVRLMVHPDFPRMPLRVTVYQAVGN